MKCLSNKRKIRIFSSLFILVIFALLFMVIIEAKAIAQTEVDWPKLPGINKEFKDFTLVDLIIYIFNFLIAIGGLTAFAMIVYGGIKYLTSVGNPSVTTEAKDRIFSALLGLVLLLSSYLLFNLINPDILVLNNPFP